MTITNGPKYTDFRGDHHAASGHWNDPPKAIFKTQKKDDALPTSSPSPPPKAGKGKLGLKGDREGAAVLSDSIPTPAEVKAMVQRVLNLLTERDLKGMDKRKLDDATKKMDILFARLDKGEVPNPVMEELDSILKDLETGNGTEASQRFLPLMQHYVESEGKWLLGLKRLIELRS
ncbi:protein transport protein S31 [Tieghemiomyces parasiticus]|uniref:Protein transport protein S31 n=1 Tax=Tieghemiomyces parasiticus TaxID=78921 RepID=A0A9W8DGI3_9FUNG|nr:protein transport protein S31 [Tieghemiomyces parasiticus]